MNKMRNNMDEKQTLFDVVVDYSYALDTLVCTNSIKQTKKP